MHSAFRKDRRSGRSAAGAPVAFSGGRVPSSPPSSPLLVSPCLLPQVPTTVYVQMPDDRAYSAILRQTEIVYDQLLAERQRKLQQKISDRQQEFQGKYRQLAQTDAVKAAEFERWAIAALSHLRDDCVEELSSVRQDYESKFIKLRISLEEQWMAEHRSPNTLTYQPPQQQQQQPTHLANFRHY